MQTLAFLRPLAPSSRQNSAILTPSPLKTADVIYGWPLGWNQAALEIRDIGADKTPKLSTIDKNYMYYSSLNQGPWLNSLGEFLDKSR